MTDKINELMRLADEYALAKYRFAHVPSAVAEARAALEDALKPGGEFVARVYLTATGETHDGQETYTRHEDAPPPLCESECLYTAPPAQTPVPQRRVTYVCPVCAASLERQEWHTNSSHTTRNTRMS